MKLLLLLLLCCICDYLMAAGTDRQPAWWFTGDIGPVQKVIDSSGKKYVKERAINEADNELKVPVWLDLNAGVSSLRLAGSASINLMLNEKFVLTATAFGTSSATTTTLFQTKSWTGFGDYSITASRVISNNPDKLIVTVGTGISFTDIRYHTLVGGSGGFFGSEFVEKNINTIGFPLELKLYIPSHTALGFNINVEARLNTEKSLFALTAGLRIGRIKSK